MVFRPWTLLLLIVLFLAGCTTSPQDQSDGAATAPDPDGPAGAYPQTPELQALGRWRAPVPGDTPAIHLTLLGDGRLLYWGGIHIDGLQEALIDAHFHPAVSRLLDPSVPEESARLPAPEDGGAGDLFCTGHAMLPDGRVLAAGGVEWNGLGSQSGSYQEGLVDARIFDPANDTWRVVEPMKRDRYYPAMLTLPDGSALVMAGTGSTRDFDQFWPTHERFDPTNETWSDLPSSADRVLPMYARIFLVPSGPLEGHIYYQPAGCVYFCSFGDHPEESTWNIAASLDLDSNTWQEHGPAVLGVRTYPVSALLPLRPPGYDAAIMVAGGALNRGVVTSTTEYTDLSQFPPSPELATPLNEPRWYANAMLLPTGEVLVTGGSQFDGTTAPGLDTYTKDAAVNTAELYDPDATDPITGTRGSWTKLAEATVPRLYHSTALLLPDATVVTAGAATIAVDGSQDYTDEIEIFEPPYLFRGERPAIGAAPEVITWDETFTLETPDAPRIDEVVLMRPGTNTHSYNPEQRLVELEIVNRDQTTLTVTAPPNPNIAPPGPWMLFLNAGSDLGLIPSEATFVQIGPRAP